MAPCNRVTLTLLLLLCLETQFGAAGAASTVDTVDIVDTVRQGGGGTTWDSTGVEGLGKVAVSTSPPVKHAATDTLRRFLAAARGSTGGTAGENGAGPAPTTLMSTKAKFEVPGLPPVLTDSDGDAGGRIFGYDNPRGIVPVGLVENYMSLNTSGASFQVPASPSISSSSEGRFTLRETGVLLFLSGLVGILFKAIRTSLDGTSRGRNKSSLLRSMPKSSDFADDEYTPRKKGAPVGPADSFDSSSNGNLFLYGSSAAYVGGIVHQAANATAAGRQNATAVDGAAGRDVAFFIIASGVTMLIGGFLGMLRASAPPYGNPSAYPAEAGGTFQFSSTSFTDRARFMTFVESFIVVLFAQLAVSAGKLLLAEGEQRLVEEATRPDPGHLLLAKRWERLITDASGGGGNGGDQGGTERGGLLQEGGSEAASRILNQRLGGEARPPGPA